MMTKPATAADFAKWTKKAKAMTMDQLHFTITDCKEAAVAMQGHNPVKSTKYMDEAFTYADERRRRQEAQARQLRKLQRKSL